MSGQQYVDSMAQVLCSLHNKIGQYLKHYKCEPVEPSLAVTERRTFAKPELISTVHSQGIVRIELAGEHMTAFARTLKEPVLNGVKLSVNPKLLCTCDQFRWGLSGLV